MTAGPAKRLFERVGYKRVLYFGLFCIALGLILFICFDDLMRNSGPDLFVLELLEDLFKWIHRHIGKTIFCSAYVVLGLVLVLEGYLGLRREKKKENL